MKKSIAKNYIYSLTYQILIIIIPLVLAPYLARVLGPENLGIYSYTISISAYFLLFGNLGISMYAKREIAYVQDNKKLISKNFYGIIIIKIITMLISLIIFYITLVRGSNVYNIYYKILIVEIIANMIDISWLYEGLELFKKTILRNVIIKILTIIAIFTLVKTNQDLNVYLGIYVISMLIGNLSLWINLHNYINKINIKEISIKKHIKPIIQLFIPQIAIQLYTILDRSMIGIMIPNKSEVGFYDQSQRLITTVLTVVTSIGSVMLPRISNIFAKGDIVLIKQYLLKSFRFVVMLGVPFIFGILVISKYFIPVYLGQDFNQVIILINILSIIILFIGMTNVIGIQYLLPIKKQKQFTISVFVGAITNFIFNIVLIPSLGTIGACIATVFAEGMVLIMQLYFVKETFKIGEIIKLSLNYFFSSIVMYIVLIILNNTVYMNASYIVKCILSIGIGGIIYALMLILLKDKLIYYILKKVFKIKLGEEV